MRGGGRAARGGELKIGDPEDKGVRHGEIGEVVCRGGGTMQGYWNRHNDTAAVLRRDPEGRTWLLTGDIATMDEEGLFAIVDRTKGIILVSGVNVYPAAIEEAL